MENDMDSKYRELGHAIQTGVAQQMALGAKDTEPKHLRTGLNLVMCDHVALAGLLIKKGIITAEEYEAAVIQGLEREKARFEKELSEAMGIKMTLA